MANLSIEKIKQAVQGENWDLAISLIEELVKQNLTEDQVGETLVGLTSLYLQAHNGISGQYLNALSNAVQILKQTDKEYREEVDGIELAFARHQLKKPFDA